MLWRRISEEERREEGKVKTDLIVRSLQLSNRISSHPLVHEPLRRSQQLQRVVHLDLAPHRQQRFDGLFCFARVGPYDRLEELG